MPRVETEPIRLLLVEDDPDDAAIVERMLSAYQRADLRVQCVHTTDECVKRLNDNSYDLLLLDYRLPQEDGLAFLQRLNMRPDAPPAIIVTGQGDERLAVQSIRAGAFDYVSKDSLSPDSLGELVCAVLRRFREHEEDRRADEQIVFALASAAADKDLSTGGHLQRIGTLAVRLGHALGLDRTQLVVIRYGAILHDVGKVAVRESILRKPGPLSQDEWEEIRQHPLIGERMCAPLTMAREVAAIVRHHHERWDGTGYVDGLAGEGIPLLARIVSIADAYDAMTSDRPYRKALPLQEARRRLEHGAGGQWDPVIVPVFLELVGGRPRRRAA